MQRLQQIIRDRRAAFEAATVGTAIVAAVAALTLTPWLSTWWLVLLVPLLAVAVLVAVTARAAAPSDRSIRRTTAVTWAVTVGIDLALVTVSDQLAYWLTAVLMFMATVGGLFAAGQLVFDVDPAESTAIVTATPDHPAR